MILSRVGQLPPRLCSSYIGISNYLRTSRTGLRAGIQGRTYPPRLFHTRSTLCEQNDTIVEHPQFLEQYKQAGTYTLYPRNILIFEQPEKLMR
ncbi:hypothetical protein BDV38DRAFT_255638 [Aspergillus pseudotamarii]|uniref:Uncharacterized protein n=1 Tax=Aspergillus pseudotamarii TaxID=132259 RepID=A0A5N6SMG4_ASPPS|nr:uncharacterized protein BDV38DRAFT_255638 [Aspergillus pseudotamarii]KAE8134324.1 hypothetical protein BDV38DRAFT_255638 [Aspergillus pseudotamarii]